MVNLYNEFKQATLEIHLYFLTHHQREEITMPKKTAIAVKTDSVKAKNVKTKIEIKAKPQSKTDFIKRVADKTSASQKDTEVFVNAFIECLQETLTQGTDQAFVGFGTFTVRDKAARTGRNPQTGEAMSIAAKRVVTFKAGLGLKQAVN